MGYVGWIEKERPVESLLVKELKSLGAIPIAKVFLFIFLCLL